MNKGATCATLCLSGIVCKEQDVAFTPLLPRDLAHKGITIRPGVRVSLFFPKQQGLKHCLRASGGFARTSAGSVGESDGYTVFIQHGDMTWEYTTAEDGNVGSMVPHPRASLG